MLLSRAEMILEGARGSGAKRGLRRLNRAAQAGPWQRRWGGKGKSPQESSESPALFAQGAPFLGQGSLCWSVGGGEMDAG